MENEANDKCLQPIGTNRNKGLTFDKSSVGWERGSHRGEGEMKKEGKTVLKKVYKKKVFIKSIKLWYRF